MNDPYSKHEAFVAPARDMSDLGRVIIVIIGAEIAFLLGPLVFATLLPGSWLENAFYEGDKPLGLVLQLFSFVVAGLALLRLVNLQHQRGFASLIGPSAIVIHDLRRCTKMVLIVLVAQIILPPWPAGSEGVTMQPLVPWILWIPVAFVAVIIQAGTEELFFRGYLQQQFAALSNNKIIWMAAPAAMFGAGHYFNGYGVADGTIYAIWAFLLGLACADLTARTGSIGAALGLHVANNMVALFYVSIQDWPSSGLALFRYPYEDPYAHDLSLAALLTPSGLLEIFVAGLMVLILWLAARIAIRA